MRIWRGLNVIEVVTAVALATAVGFAVLPGYTRKSEQARVAALEHEMSQVAAGLAAYFIDHGSYPASGIAQGGERRYEAQQIWQPRLNATIPTDVLTVNSHVAVDAGARRLVTFRLPRSEAGESFATLTSPIAYVGNFPEDPFAHTSGASLGYFAHQSGLGWILFSVGPDRDENAYGGPGDISPRVETLYDLNASFPYMWQPSPALLEVTYDPSNGIFSSGDVWRVEGM